MENVRVRLMGSGGASLKDLERAINLFIEDKDVIDIKYQESVNNLLLHYSALIIYKEDKNTLFQKNQEANDNLYQYFQKAKDTLIKSTQRAKGDLYQEKQKVEDNSYSCESQKRKENSNVN